MGQWSILQRIPSVPFDIFLLVLASAPALAPLAAPGYIKGEDWTDPPWRSLEILRALSEGVLFPRWSGDLIYGYGFPLFNFYSPLSFYPAALMAAVAPIGLLDASEVSFGFAMVLAGIGAYVLARSTTKHRGAALLAGVLYMYAPKLVGDIYLRATLASIMSLGVLPFALAAFVRVWERPTLRASGVTALLIGMLILVHNTTAAMGLGMMVAYAAFRFLLSRDRRGLPLAALALALGIGAVSFYWLPASRELSLTHVEKITEDLFDFRFHFIDPLGSTISKFKTDLPWYVYSQTDRGPFDLHLAYPYGAPPHRLGLFQGLLLLLTGAVLIAARKRPAPVVALFLVTLLLYYGTISWSQWIWEITPGADLVQFPWRLTGPLSLTLAVASSWALFQLLGRWRGRAMPLVLLALVVGVVYNSMALSPKTPRPFPTGPVINLEHLFQWQSGAKERIGTMCYGQLLPLTCDWRDQRSATFMDRFGETFPEAGWTNMTAYLPRNARAWVLSSRRGQQWMEATIEAAEPVTVPFRAIYFPGWTAYLDGQRVPVTPSPWMEYEEHRVAALGVCLVEVPQGTHQVRLVFEDTPIRTLATWIAAVSGFGIGVVFLGAYWRRRRRVTKGRAFALLVVGWLVVAGGFYLGSQALFASRLPSWVDNPVVRDLLAETEEKLLRVTVLPGEQGQNQLLLKSYTINGDTRPILYMHPPASVSTRVWLPSDARLEFAIAMDPEVWTRAAGAVYKVDIRHGDEQQNLFTYNLDPRLNPSDQRWIDVSLDLARFAHREVELVLSTSAGTSADYDWGGWARPRVVVGGTP